jgi:hypothetical protein
MLFCTRGSMRLDLSARPVRPYRPVRSTVGGIAAYIPSMRLMGRRQGTEMAPVLYMYGHVWTCMYMYVPYMMLIKDARLHQSSRQHPLFKPHGSHVGDVLDWRWLARESRRMIGTDGVLVSHDSSRASRA